MSRLKYSNYKGYGEKHSSGYSQAVRIGDRIEISGQGKSQRAAEVRVFSKLSDYTGPNKKTGGWDQISEEISTDLGKQFDQAFANVETTLTETGGKGWEQVYKIRCYSAPWTDEAVEHLVRNIEKYCPNHRPIVTGIGVDKLAYENMQVEIEVAAHLGP